MHVHVFTTGGTIDKVYFDAASTYQVGAPMITELFREAGVAFTYSVDVLLQKDSLEFSDADRALVARSVRDSEHARILVTHGTDTMAETARTVARALAEAADASKTVVFFGSLTPARFKSSDAEFNVGFAAAAVQTLDPGVYVAMNGCVFDPHRVQKDRERNRFAAVTPSAPSS